VGKECAEEEANVADVKSALRFRYT